MTFILFTVVATVTDKDRPSVPRVVENNSFWSTSTWLWNGAASSLLFICKNIWFNQQFFLMIWKSSTLLFLYVVDYCITVLLYYPASRLGHFCVQFACFPPSVWLLCRYSGFLPQSKDIQVFGLIGDSNLPKGMNVSPVMNWQPVQGVPASCLMSAGISSSSMQPW